MNNKDEYGQPYALSIDDLYESIKPAMDEWGNKVANRIKERLGLEHLTNYELGDFIEKVIASDKGTVFDLDTLEIYSGK